MQAPAVDIIVIEDQDDVRENLVETLELAGYRVAEAADGHRGVALARELRPRLVLCDVMMPRLDGFGVLKLLGEHPDTAHVPLVFLTAKAEREDLRRGMNLGAADYLTKPFFQDELLRVVELRLVPRADGDVPVPSGAPDGAIATGTGTGSAALDALAERGRARAYRDRATIYFTGDRAHAVYRVQRGHVRLFGETDFGKALTVDILGPGAWFGWEDALAESSHRLHAAAYPEADVAVVDVADFTDQLARHPALLRLVARHFAQDLQFRAEALLQVAYFSVRKRLAEFLLRQGGGQGAAAGQLIELRREDMAEAIASTPETVTRMLTEFRKDGLIELNETGLVRLRDQAGLGRVPS